MGPEPYTTTLSLEDVSVIRLGETIVGNVSFTLSPGEAAMLAGPNGSGKTSLLRAIAGFCRSTGAISLAAKDTGGDEPGQSLHYVGHDNGLNRRLAASDHIRFWSKLLGTGITRSEAHDILVRLALPEVPVWKLSAGQGQRLALARLLAAPRPIWLLDEPVTALDTEGRALLATLCTEHRAAGGVIVASTHGLMTLPDALTLTLHRPAAGTPVRDGMESAK